MLLHRVLTAVVLLPLLVAAIWYLPPGALYLLFCAIGGLMAWEWTALMPLKGAARAVYCLLTLALLAAAWTQRWTMPWLAVLAGLWWLAAIALVRGFPANLERRPPSLPLMAALGWLMFVSCLLSILQLHQAPAGPLRVLFLFFLIFAADTGAYFVGRSLGRRKLAPRVSPGKSIEGAVGGLSASGLLAWFAGPAVFAVEGGQRWALLLVCVIVAAFSIVGDLVESLFKRRAGVKDSGAILPGHGGILDRVDSLLAAAPLLVLGLWVIGL